jgi:hypothetical protein
MAKLFKTETTRAAAHGGLLAFSFFASLFTLLLEVLSSDLASSGKLYGEQLLESFEIRPAELTDGLTFSGYTRPCRTIRASMM